MIIKAEDERVVKVVPRDNGWVFIEVMWLSKADVWERKSVTLTASELAEIYKQMIS